VADAKDLNVRVETTLMKRLKIQSALTGQTIKALVAKILDEKLPPLPQGSEATA
jgi:predicted HicB family RNase H-like nuclease